MAREGKISLSVSSAILDELGDVLARKFKWPPEDIAGARSRITAMARTVTPAMQLDIIREDPPDNRILECAVAAESDYIVSGDKGFTAAGAVRMDQDLERCGFSRHGTARYCGIKATMIQTDEQMLVAQQGASPTCGKFSWKRAGDPRVNT